MKKFFALIMGLFFAISAYAIDPIIGSTSTCVGWVATLSDATPGGSWSSSNPSVATVSASGSVTGMSIGSCTITYTVGASFVTSPFSVNAATAVTGPTSVCTGNLISLTGTPAGGSWTSGTPTVATVSPSGVVTGVGTGVVNIYYTGGGCYAYQIINVGPSIPAITGITTVGTGNTTLLSNTVAGGAWTSSNASIATVGSASGIVTGVTAGSCNITYTHSGCYATALVTVTASISPISGATSTCAGTTATVTATPSGGVWSSSNTSVATINAMGVVTGVTAGTVTITYAIGTAYVTRAFTVNTTPAISGSGTVCAGMTIPLTATPAGGTWSTTSSGIASVGTTGIVTGISGGVATITYTRMGCSAHKTITVSPAASITGSGLACIGSPLPLTATPSGGAWSSSSPGIATVGSTGVVSGLAAGTVTITYTAGSCFATKSVTVNSSPSVSGGTSVCVGATVPLAGTPSGGTWSSASSAIATVSPAGVVTGTGAGLAMITYTQGSCYRVYTVSVNPVPVITGSSMLCVGMTSTLMVTPTGGSWTSGSPSVATVSPTGLVTAVSTGVVNIYYTASGCYSFKPITINPAPAPITGTTTTTPGGTTTLSNATPGGIWSSSNTLIAVVGSATGIVTGAAAGFCNITYSVGGCYVYVPFTVGSTSLTPITGPSGACVGTTATLSNATPGGTWSSSNPSVATINSFGVISGIAAGTATITYTVGAFYVTHLFTVAPPATISGAPSVCVGLTGALTASVPGGTWTSSHPAIASVSSSGVVTGVGAGVASISYYSGGCYSLFTITVNAGPIITGSDGICLGYTDLFTATPSGGSWTSGSPGIATVSPTGLVTAVSPGVVNIYYTQGGCYIFKPVTVSMGATISGPDVSCVGTSVTLSSTPSGGTWSSSNAMIATVGTAGIVTGLSSGVVHISYTMGGCASYKTMTINTTPLISGDGPVCVGDTRTLSASFSGGTWSSSNTAIATILSSGVVTGVSSGVVNITYTTGGCFAYKTITVSASPTISGSSSVCVGSPVTLSGSPSGGTWSSSNTFRAIVNTMGVVTGLGGGAVNISYSLGTCYAYQAMTVNGTPIITGSGGPICSGNTLSLSGSSSGGTWSSSNTAIATVDASGMVTGVSGGVANITFTIGGCFTFKSVTINTSPSITGGSTACIGSALALTGTPSGGTWTSSNTFRATVNPFGTVTGLTTGTVNITYTLGSCYTYRTVTVTGAPIILGSSIVCSGSSILLSASSGGSWSSSAPSVATVDPSGNVMGISSGTATITYSLSGCFSTKPVTVNPTPTITGGSGVCIGTPLHLIGSPSSGVWASSNPSRATVSASGMVTGISAGVVNITYTLNGCYTVSSLTISAGATISGSGPVCVGSTISLSASAGGGTWSSSSTAIASVVSGDVTGVGAGVAIISYTIGGGCYATKAVTVNPNPAPITGPTSVALGSSITLSSITPGGTWVSYTPTVAMANPATGLITGLTPGTSDIHYWAGGCSVYKTIVVYFSPFGPSTPVSNDNVAYATGAVADVFSSSKQPNDDDGQDNIKPGNSLSGAINVSPNPSHGDLTVQWQGLTTGSFEVIVSDMAGRKVHTSTLNVTSPSGQSQITLSGLKDGIYLLTIFNGSEKYQGKLFIQN